MPGYKVSYKVLGQQGDELKALAKQVDGYSSRVDEIRRHLGNDKLLAATRQNLKKLSQQLDESRNFLNKAGEIASRCVEGYHGIEVTIVKKVDSTRAHNRDFYKNPVMVASAEGGAAASYASASASVHMSAPSSAPPQTHIEYTDNSTVNYNFDTVSQSTSPSLETMQFTTNETPTPFVHDLVSESSPQIGNNANTAPDLSSVGVAAGSAAVAGGIYGSQKLKEYLDRKDAEKQAEEAAKAQSAEEDPEVLLAQAIKEVEKYRKEEKKNRPPDRTPKLGEY